MKKFNELSVGMREKSLKFAFVSYKDHGDPIVTMT